MSDNSSTHDVEDQLARRRSSEVEIGPAPLEGLGHIGTPPPGYSATLLRDPRLGSRANGEARAEILHGAQRTHGNRAVQRFLNAASAAEEMDTEEDDYLARRIESLSGGGSSLDENTRGKLERGLGSSLAGVRIHTGEEADHLSREMHAVAFTTGQDIFFRSGLFNPHTPEGLRLLAHEATHTVQQSHGAVDGTPTTGGVSISDPSDQFEQAAERAADAVVAGGQVASSKGATSTPVPMQRKLEGEDDAFVQRYPALPVQREDEEGDDFRIGMLPPELHVPMGPVALDADTSRAELGYRRPGLSLGLGYEYGGDIFARGSYGGLSGQLGFNPGDERFNLSGRYGDFSGSAYAGLNGGVGLSLGYGDPLLPMPADLSRSIYAGEAGMRNMIGGLPGIMNDPIAGIGRHSGDISAMGGAGSALAGIAGASDSRFGAGVRLSFDPTLGVTAWGGIQGRF